MGIDNTQQYKDEVSKKLEILRPVFAKAIIGDFSENINIPEDDEFSELYTGIQTMIEVVRGKIEDLQKEIGEREEVEKLLLKRTQEQGNTQKAMTNVLEDLNMSRSRAEKERAEYEALLSSVQDGIFAIDKNGVIIFFNNAAEKMLLWKANQVMGKNLADFLDLEDGRGKKVMIEGRPFSEAVRSGKITSLNDYYYVRKNGTKFPTQFTISPVLSGDKNVGAIEVFRDITESKALDRAKSEFISIASHQLRTPVTATKWLAELFRESMHKLTPKEREYLNDLSTSIERLSHLVEDLLNVSRIELGTLKPDNVDINFNNFVEDFIRDISAYATLKKHNIVLKKEFEGESKVLMDSKMLYNILQNLVSNAIDYSPADTTVTVSVGKKEGFIKISVSNQGPVIPKDEQAKLFQKFYRGESTKKIKTDGTGLGLYIVKSNIESAGGEVGFRSEKGEETIFWFSLPIKK